MFFLKILLLLILLMIIGGVLISDYYAIRRLLPRHKPKNLQN